MKHIITKAVVAAVITLVGINSFAADELNDIIRCRAAAPAHDTGVSVTVSTGGIAGMTQLRVERFLLGKKQVQNFIVQKEVQNPQTIGSPTVYKGENVSFSVNFTTAPLKDGSRIGHLAITKGQNISTDELSCKMVQTKQDPKTVVMIKGIDTEISTIELKEGGTLLVTSTKGQEKTLQLSEKNQQELLNDAKVLGQVEITEEIRQIVCKMFVSPLFYREVWALNNESNSLVMVLSAQNCAMSRLVSPKEVHYKNMANEIKSQLIVLAQQLKF